MAISGKKTENGRLYFGDKTAKYLEKKSRQAVEGYHNSPILYFEVDFMKSKKNFYGEMTIKKFKNNKGVSVKGIYKMQQGDEQLQQGIPNKIMKLTVSLYVEQLAELDIKPSLGDYFGIGNRLYLIYDKTLEDAGPGNLMMNRGRMRQDFLCIQEDDEALEKNAFSSNLGLESEINPATDI
ncbi:MAG: hypothetical protein ABIP51_16770 [Bacteroidia bacterium]